MELPQSLTERIDQLSSKPNRATLPLIILSRQYIAYGALAMLIAVLSASGAYFQARLNVRSLETIFVNLEKVTRVQVASLAPFRVDALKPEPSLNPWRDIEAFKIGIHRLQALSLTKNVTFGDY